mmetsp:Transcript_54954/g.125095  ORF Transcript_54954/g.125095 Transcript_54954/m.125095 type:complete len:368 (-) Transcript_54954:2427-3530(-)
MKAFFPWAALFLPLVFEAQALVKEDNRQAAHPHVDSPTQGGFIFRPSRATQQNENATSSADDDTRGFPIMGAPDQELQIEALFWRTAPTDTLKDQLASEVGDATLENFGVVREMQSVELSAANNLAKEHRIVATADLTKNPETTTNTKEKEGPTAQHKKEDPKPAELHLINVERDELAEKLLPGEAAKDKTVLSTTTTTKKEAMIRAWGLMTGQDSALELGVAYHMRITLTSGVGYARVSVTPSVLKPVTQLLSLSRDEKIAARIVNETLMYSVSGLPERVGGMTLEPLGVFVDLSAVLEKQSTERNASNLANENRTVATLTAIASQATMLFILIAISRFDRLRLLGMRGDLRLSTRKTSSMPSCIA